MGNTRICDYRRRPPRIEQLSSGVRPFYFVTFNTHKRLPLLARPEIHETFRSFCFIAQEHEVAVGRYVLAPEHVHVFLSLPSTGIRLEKCSGVASGDRQTITQARIPQTPRQSEAATVD